MDRNLTENVWEVLPLYDVTVTANGKWPYRYYNGNRGKLDQWGECKQTHVLLAPPRGRNRYMVYQMSNKGQV